MARQLAYDIDEAARAKDAGGLVGRLENVIDPFHDTDREVLPKDAFSFIWYFARQAKGPFLLLLLVGALTGGVDAALYWSVGWLIDILDAADPATIFADHWPELLGLAALIFIVRAAVLVFAAVVEQQIVVPSFFSMVRWQSFRRVMEQPYGFYQNDFAGRIATKVLQAGEATGDFITGVLQTLWSFVTFLVLAVAILAAIDPWMGVIIGVWSLGYVAIVRLLLPRLRKAGRETADARSVLNGRMVDAFTNIVAVKLFDTSRREHGHVREGQAFYLSAVRRMTRMITGVRSAVAVLNGFMMTGVGYVAILQWQGGGMTTGEIAATLGLVLRLNQMSGWMMFNINGLIRSYATVQDAVGTVSVKPAIADSATARPLPDGPGLIRFEDVSFHYDRDEGVIDALSLTIRPGERIALVGPSGAGKSTIVSLLVRLFDVESGRITIDGHDIRDVTQASLRERFGVVTQEPMLMHRSIRDNILYGRPGASMAEVEAAARMARADVFIPDLRDPKGRSGYDAHVGERGVKLSGGQRQRIALARVFLKNAPVLILDEATSALDSEAEAAIQESLTDLMAGKTVIAIAHRLSTIAALDRLIVLDQGRIVEEGRHDELARSGGLYARLWKRQSGGFVGLQKAAE